MRRKVGEQTLAFVERGGLALGICNGFQVLARLGLLPRIGGGELRAQISLADNLSDHYECRWVTLGSVASRCVFLEEGLTLRFPAAHAEGYLMPADEETARTLEDGYRAFVYLDDAGNPHRELPRKPQRLPRRPRRPHRLHRPRTRPDAAPRPRLPRPPHARLAAYGAGRAR